MLLPDLTDPELLGEALLPAMLVATADATDFDLALARQLPVFRAPIIDRLVEETARAAKEITLSTQQQTSACEQMAETMGEVRDVAQQVAMSARETERTISDILEQIGKLKELSHEEE